MNKVFRLALAAAAVAFAGSALADAANVRILFSTVGPDCYADGTPALAGESYALCWSPAGRDFGGFNLDGTAAVEGDKVVLRAPFATGGAESHCPTMFFEVDTDYIAANGLAGGSYSVYLLDTRSASNMSVLSPDGVVNGAALIPATVTVSGTASADCTSVETDGALAFGESAVPAEYANPQIVDFNPFGDVVLITVTGLSPNVRYNIRKGATIGALTGSEVELGSDAKAGGVSNVGVTFEVEKGDANFFTVVRQPLDR